MDDRVLGAMMRCGLPCSVIGDAIGNAMSVSVVERLARRLLSQRHCACVSVWLSDFLSLTGSSSPLGSSRLRLCPKIVGRWRPVSNRLNTGPSCRGFQNSRSQAYRVTTRRQPGSVSVTEISGGSGVKLKRWAHCSMGYMQLL